MSEKIYQRFELAKNQLKTAILLFLTENDKFSVITLAGAADVIFSQLITRHGKENFADFISKKATELLSRQETGKDINDTLRINALKHMDSSDDEYVSLDAYECALAAIMKAIANYRMLGNKYDVVIIGFLGWVKENIDLNKYNFNSDLETKKVIKAASSKVV